MSKKISKKDEKEFSAYGKNKEIVRDMVVYDKKELVDKLYNSVSVPYIEDIKHAFEIIVSNQTSIVCTHVKMLDSYVGDISKENYHAVCFVRLHQTGTIYFFDPNGAVDIHSQFKFVIDGMFMTTAMLVTTLQKGRPLIVKFGKNNGVQAFSTSTKSSAYINEGGYCMFYIYVFMQAVMEFAKQNNTDVSKVDSYVDWVINYRYTELDSGIFPHKTQISRVSKTIVDTAFP